MTEEKYKSFKDQLEELPPEFALYMEEYREAHFSDLIKYIVDKFDLKDELENMTLEEQNKIIELFKVFHNFGFYGGVAYAIDPQQKYSKKY